MTMIHLDADRSRSVTIQITARLAWPPILRTRGYDAAVRWLLLIAIAGCEFAPPPGTGDNTPKDAAVDAPPDAPPDAFDPLCYGAGAFYFCLPAAPPGPITINGGDIDTSLCNNHGGAVATVGGSEVCLIDGTAVTIAGDIGVFGSRPLVLVASGTLTIGVGVSVDISSKINSNFPGPGSDPTDCNTTGIDGVPGGNGGGGGAGGSFGAKGGNGGDGNAGAGGTATTPLVLDKLRGGCKGGAGAPGGGLRANPGEGGGAIMLAAHAAIVVDGRIDGSGAGGEGGNTSKGGGAGGGSGGMIVFHAPMLNVSSSARIVANGGGGGAGAGQTQPGGDGSDPDRDQPATPAPAGQTNTGGAVPGGNGGAKASQAGNGTNGGNGGGGGGGGTGVIRVLAGGVIPDAVVSPAPTS
jgi:hypothetical protein